mgnify:CR=1 FL=1
MTKKVTNNTINREITFPIKIDGHNITASPGDSVSSALYYNKKQLNKKIKIHGNRDLIFSKKINQFILTDEGCKVNLGFDELLEQEAYPGLEIKANNLICNLSYKFLEEFSVIFPGNSKKIFDNFFLQKNNNQSNMNFVERVELISSQILIVGGGISGLFAASILVNAGLKVVLIERDFILGGIIYNSNHNLRSWVKNLISNLKNSNNCRIFKNTKLIYADDKSNFFAVRKVYHKEDNSFLKHSFTLLKIVAENTIIATGLKERSIYNINTDNPNIMLAGKVQQLICRFGLTVPNGVIIYTNNNFGWDTAFKILSLGIEIKAVIDTREYCDFSISCPVFRGAQIVKIRNNSNLKSLKILNNNGKIVNLKTSHLIVSGGFDLNLGSITEVIESLSWCSKNSTFIPNKYSKNIDILSDFNNIFCTSSLLQNTANISSKILRKHKLKVCNFQFPTFEKHKLDSELLKDIDYYKNVRFSLFNKLKDITSPEVIFNHFFYKQTSNGFIDLKLDALRSFSNDKLILKDIKNNLFLDETANEIKLSFMINKNLIKNHSFNELKTPYRSLKCNDFYNEIGSKNYLNNGWLIPKYFYKKTDETAALSNIDFELSLIDTVGLADYSDLAKISIVGKDAIVFLQSIINLNDINFDTNRFFSFILAKKDNLFFDRLLVLVLNKDYILLLLDAQIEGEFYDYLSSKLLIKQNELKCNIFKETDIFQVFSLVGKLANKLIADKFKTGKSLLSKKSKNSIHKINYLGHDLFIIFQNIGSIYFIDIIINSICAVQFLKEVYPSLVNMNGGLIGRESFEKIKLDSGIISWKNFKKNELQPPTVINSFIPAKITKFSDNYYKIYLDEFIYSKVLCLMPKGLTKNIVKGSNVYHYLNGKKISLLGKVVFCFYSKRIRKMIAFTFFSKQYMNFDLVLVENISKNYQTLCEVKKYNELFPEVY